MKVFWGNVMYTEITSIQEESNVFRSDFKKVILCIESSKTVKEVETSWRLYKLFRDKHKLNNVEHDVSIKKQKLLIARQENYSMYTGYVEYLFETKFITTSNGVN
jgi:hypothetical protein